MWKIKIIPPKVFFISVIMGFAAGAARYEAKCRKLSKSQTSLQANTEACITTKITILWEFSVW